VNGDDEDQQVLDDLYDAVRSAQQALGRLFVSTATGLGSRTDLVERLAALQSITSMVPHIRAAHEKALAELMERDDETIAGMEVHRTRPLTNTWTGPMVDDARRAVLRRLAVNEVTGEIDEQRYEVLARGWEAAARCFRQGGDTVRLTALDSYAFNARDYRSQTPGPWKIHVDVPADQPPPPGSNHD